MYDQSLKILGKLDQYLFQKDHTLFSFCSKIVKNAKISTLRSYKQLKHRDIRIFQVILGSTTTIHQVFGFLCFV